MTNVRGIFKGSHWHSLWRHAGLKSNVITAELYWIFWHKSHVNFRNWTWAIYIYAAACVPLRRNGNGTGTESMRVMDWVMGTGREPGIFLGKDICQCQPANKNLRIASESDKVFARILNEFLRCLDLPRISVFSRWTIQNFITLTPPLVFWNWKSFHSLTKHVFFLVIVNIKVYKRKNFIRDHVAYVWIFILYVYIYINVSMYVHVYVCMYMYVMYR